MISLFGGFTNYVIISFELDPVGNYNDSQKCIFLLVVYYADGGVV